VTFIFQLEFCLDFNEKIFFFILVVLLVFPVEVPLDLSYLLFSLSVFAVVA
jgi:hypothetical protein